MEGAQIEGRRTSRMMEEHIPIVQDALRIFFDRKILERVGFASREDIVKMNVGTPARVETVVAQLEPVNQAERAAELNTGVITTETELRVFDWVKTRLSFLVEDEEMFKCLDDLFYVDYKTVFSVCYKQERKGKLFNFRELTDGTYRFDFPENDGEPVEFKDRNFVQIDQPLLESFRKRVADLK